MKDCTLTVKINAIPKEIFDFSLNPQNTPLWIETMQKEESNEYPPKLGTIYRNTNNGKDWDEYSLTEFDKDRLFTLTAKNGNYSVRYTLTQLSDGTTELEYYEWVEEGELENPFEQKHLEKLKEVIEKTK